MIPGEVIPLAGEIALNEDRKSTRIVLLNLTVILHWACALI